MMQDIRPFRGWRYAPTLGNDISDVIAPPYDVVAPEQQRALYAKSQYNVIRVELTAAEPGDADGQVGVASRHARAGATLDAWRRQAVLQRDPSAAYYLYSQSFSYSGRAYLRRSLMAAVRIVPWSSGKILPHERTLSAPRAERLGLMKATNTNLSPIWALYQDKDQHIGAVVAVAQSNMSTSSPVIATSDGVVHQLDVLDAPDVVQRLSTALSGTRLYIADGHHRYETALAYSQAQQAGEDHPAGWVMMALTDVDDPGLIVMPTHRLLRGLDETRVSRLPTLLGESFNVTHMPLPDSGVDFQSWLEALLEPPMGGGRKIGLLGCRSRSVTLLEPRAASMAAMARDGTLANLDVWIAQKLVLQQGLGLSEQDVERETYIRYTRDAMQARHDVETGSAQLALVLPATPVQKMIDVASAGAVMPQKSTYFYPKLATGMVIRSLDEW